MAVSVQPVVYYLAVSGDENAYENDADMQGKYLWLFRLRFEWVNF